MLQPYKSFGTVCAVASLLYAQTAPSPSGTDLKVKPMLARPFGQNSTKEIWRQIKIDKMCNSQIKIITVYYLY